MKLFNVGRQFSPKPPKTLGKAPRANVNRGNKTSVDSDKTIKPAAPKNSSSSQKPMAIPAPKVEKPTIKLSQ